MGDILGGPDDDDFEIDDAAGDDADAVPSIPADQIRGYRKPTGRKPGDKASEGTGRGHRYVPSDKDRGTVQGMSAMGATLVDIAAVLRVSDKTVAKHYGYELRTAATIANHNMARRLYTVGLKGTGPGAVRAQMFWLRTRAGFKDTSRHEVTGANGAPLASGEKTIVILPSNGRESDAMQPAASPVATPKPVEE